MKINRIVPVVSTKSLTESKEFYTKHFGFQILFDSDWYVQLASSQDGNLQIAFIVPNHKSQPPIFQSEFDGKGIFYTLEVDDADFELERLKKEGVEISLDIQDEPWGERHFAVKDPNKIILNVSQPIPPTGEFVQD